MTIRNAVRSDLARITEIMIRSFRSSFAGFVSSETMDRCTNECNCQAMLEQLYQQDTMHFLIGETSGMLIWQQYDDHAELEALHVLPEFHGTGLGHALLTEALRQIGGSSVHLWAFKENHRARRFYEKHGFHWDGRERISEFDDAVEICYVLP